MSRRNVPWHERLHNRLLAGDQTGAWKVVEAALASGTTPAGVYTDMLAPALRSIGDAWEAGEIGIESEHQASVIVGRIIGRLGPRFSPPGRRKGSVVVAGPAGDRHALGLAMAGDILRGGGYLVVDLGPDTPAQALAATLMGVQQMRAVCIGVANPAALDAVTETVRVARRYLDRHAPVVLGGGAVADDGHAQVLGADRRADLVDIVEAVEVGREAQPVIHI